MTVDAGNIADKISVSEDNSLWVTSSSTGVAYRGHVILGRELSRGRERKSSKKR